VARFTAQLALGRACVGAARGHKDEHADEEEGDDYEQFHFDSNETRIVVHI